MDSLRERRQSSRVAAAIAAGLCGFAMLTACGTSTAPSPSPSATAGSDGPMVGSSQDAGPNSPDETNALSAVVPFAGNYPLVHAPLADGDVVDINDNQALYALLGSTFGGDGRTTFALPALTPLATKSGPGVQWLIVTNGVFPAGSIPRPQARGEVFFIATNRDVDTDQVTPDPSMDSIAGTSIHAWKNDQRATTAAAIVGELDFFPSAEAPEGFLPADGRTLQIRDFPDLYSVIGKEYGGDGETTFALPDIARSGNYQWAIAVKGGYPHRA